MQDLRNRVTILAVGVSRYADPFLRQLQGPENDLEILRDLLVENPATALYETKLDQNIPFDLSLRSKFLHSVLTKDKIRTLVPCFNEMELK